MSRMTTNDAMDAVFNARNAPRGLDDSDRNILADLAGEADEPCARCDTPVRPSPTGPTTHGWDFETADGDPLCEDCATPTTEGN